MATAQTRHCWRGSRCPPSLACVAPAVLRPAHSHVESADSPLSCRHMSRRPVSRGLVPRAHAYCDRRRVAHLVVRGRADRPRQGESAPLARQRRSPPSSRDDQRSAAGSQLEVAPCLRPRGGECEHPRPHRGRYRRGCESGSSARLCASIVLAQSTTQQISGSVKDAFGRRCHHREGHRAARQHRAGAEHNGQRIRLLSSFPVFPSATSRSLSRLPGLRSPRRRASKSTSTQKRISMSRWRSAR